MTARAVAITGELGILVTAIGLIARGRWRLNYLFAMYIASVLVCEALIICWPATFFVYGFWLAKELAYASLLLGAVLEVGWRTFHPFEGAAFRVRNAVALILAITLLAVSASASHTSYAGYAGKVYPRVVNGTIWLIAATLGMAWWYRIPVHPFHAAIATSSAAYLAIFSTALSLFGLYGWEVRTLFNVVDPGSYILVTCWWAFVAWRRDSAVAVSHVETLHRLGAHPQAEPRPVRSGG